MNQYDHIIKKNLLWSKIKGVAQRWGENDNEIAIYAKEVYEAYKHDLDVAINCFDDLLKQAKIIFPEYMDLKKCKPLKAKYGK